MQGAVKASDKAARTSGEGVRGAAVDRKEGRKGLGRVKASGGDNTLGWRLQYKERR